MFIEKPFLKRTGLREGSFAPQITALERAGVRAHTTKRLKPPSQAGSPDSDEPHRLSPTVLRGRPQRKQTQRPRPRAPAPRPPRRAPQRGSRAPHTVRPAPPRPEAREGTRRSPRGCPRRPPARTGAGGCPLRPGLLAPTAISTPRLHLLASERSREPAPRKRAPKAPLFGPAPPRPPHIRARGGGAAPAPGAWRELLSGRGPAEGGGLGRGYGG